MDVRGFGGPFSAIWKDFCSKDNDDTDSDGYKNDDDDDNYNTVLCKTCVLHLSKF